MLITKIVSACNVLVKSTANKFGFQYVGIGRVPVVTMLGLVNDDIEIVLDIGANSGQFCRYITRLMPAVELHAFEPLPTAYRELEIWKNKNEQYSVRTYHLALGDIMGVKQLNEHMEFSPSSSFLNSTELLENKYPDLALQKKTEVKVDRLDNVLFDYLHASNKKILVKMDVQGYEEVVLAGAEKCLSIVNAVVIEVSLIDLYENQAKFHNLVSKRKN